MSSKINGFGLKLEEARSDKKISRTICKYRHLAHGPINTMDVARRQTYPPKHIKEETRRVISEMLWSR